MSERALNEITRDSSGHSLYMAKKKYQIPSPYSQHLVPPSAAKLSKGQNLSLPPLATQHRQARSGEKRVKKSLDDLFSERAEDQRRLEEKNAHYHEVQKRISRETAERVQRDQDLRKRQEGERLKALKEEYFRKKHEAKERLQRMREKRERLEESRKTSEEAAALKKSQVSYARQRDMHKLNEERWKAFEEDTPEIITYQVWLEAVNHSLSLLTLAN